MLRRDRTRRGLGRRGPPSGRDSDGKWSGVAEGEGVSVTAPSPELEVRPGDDHDDDGDEHHGRGGKTLAEVLGEEHVVVHVFGRYLRRYPGTTAGHCDHEVVDAYNAMTSGGPGIS